MPKNDSPDSGVRQARHTFRFALPSRSPPLVFEGARRPGARVQYYATLYGSDSYANVADIVARALVERMPDTALWNYVGGRIDDPALAPHSGLNHAAPVGIFFGFPVHAPTAFLGHRIRIGVFVCEADQIPPEWVRACNRFHLIAVPSRFCRNAFLRSGVTTPVMVVPHGVHPAHAPGRTAPPDDRFVFYNNFRCQVAGRKGYRELVRCFQAAFQGRDDVVLRLRAGDARWLPACRGWPDFGGLVEFDPPEPLSMDEAAAVYSAVHCTVHPSKGEGFGLVPLESIACGTPVIAPAHTGMADYLGPDNAVILRTGETIRAPRADHQCGRYHSVDEEHLIELLRRMPERWPEEQERLVEVGEDVRRRYAWPRLLGPFLDVVEQALQCEDRRDIEDITGAFLEPGELARHHEEAGRRALARPAPPESHTDRFRFSSIVYCGWDYPRDGVGNHLRLLDGLIFNGPEIRCRSLDELSGTYYPGLYGELASHVHEQRPDLFQGCLYLDVVGFHGDRAIIERQIERVYDMKRRFAARTAIYLMWESNRLWAPVLDLVRAYDLVMVSSDLLVDYFKANDVRFAVLPHPYRYAVERPGPQRAPGDPITIGLSAGMWPRKNLALVAETFAQTLGNQPDVRLRIHSRLQPADPRAGDEKQRIDEAVAACGNIEFVLESLSRDQYLDWLRSLDVYCFLSSGEAWSVTPREALHLGKPVILLDAHAHAGFSHLPGVIPVAPGPPRPASPGARFVDGDIGVEASVDTVALQAVFRDLPRHYREADAALAGRFEEIPAHHCNRSVRTQWVRTLNALFDESVDIR